MKSASFLLLVLDAIVLNLTNQYVELLDKEQLITREYQPQFLPRVLYSQRERETNAPSFIPARNLKTLAPHVPHCCLGCSLDAGISLGYKPSPFQPFPGILANTFPVDY